MRSLNLNVRPPFQETLDPPLDIMTSLGPPKRYFAPRPTEPVGGAGYKDAFFYTFFI